MIRTGNFPARSALRLSTDIHVLPGIIQMAALLPMLRNVAPAFPPILPMWAPSPAGGRARLTAVSACEYPENTMHEVQGGPCRLICGDALEVMATLEGAVDLIVTDPPYRLTSGGKKGQVMGGKFSRDRYDNSGELMRILRWDEMAEPMFRCAKPDADIYVMANNKQVFPAHSAMLQAGWRDHNLLTWEKPSPTRNRWYMKNLEFTLYMFKGRAKTIRRPGSLQNFPAPRPDIDWHPTAKPVELFEHYILNSSDPGDLVLDPFGGSGTCAMAAMRTGRRCISIELNEEWFDRKVARLQQELKATSAADCQADATPPRPARDARRTPAEKTARVATAG